MKLRSGAFLPNLITTGNGICGFAAIVKLMKIEVVAAADGTLSFTNPEEFVMAAWLIVLGMVFDVFDGQVARFSNATSDLGAQLDSFCDLLTFGVAPALLVVRLNMVYSDFWQKIVWFLCLAYFVGALLRLARFNVENDHAEDAHLAFKGLPTPAAAGCIASLVIFSGYLTVSEKRELVYLAEFLPEGALQSIGGDIPYILPVLALVLGWTMVSDRLKFDHVATQLFHRNQSFNLLAYLLFGGALAFILPEVILPLIFIGYLFYTPTRTFVDWVFDRNKAASTLEKEPDANAEGKSQS